ncbi:uncharacterized protein M421DRAFT_6287 [Didymella exigua CBS 183.55]|uniref:Uncharacterized protein n=1 Tax=Didymella exigua CBS 183.55 TaxID=1150837 RepID=A0A6A5RL28_9PLEO|nr:uncharacterized protein M421DRAFT_6287 [Didymella exigua CBS 183.55]KAF1927076.1 hypothetical protein M421DRAFT_6287 [Didymella exigua CBS 183.55]
MQFLTLALLLFTFSTTAFASSPNPSYTHIQINNAPTPITKSRVSTHLRRAAEHDSASPQLNKSETDDAHAALHHVSTATPDATTDGVKARVSGRGMSRRTASAAKARSGPVDDQMRRGTERRGTDEKEQARRSMGKGMEASE